MDFKKDEQMIDDLSKLIHDIKIQQQASAMYDQAHQEQSVEEFKQITLKSLEKYLISARSLLRK
jgi:hypothetical protein